MKMKCPTCGQKFEQIVPWKRYCSGRCRVAAFRQREKEAKRGRLHPKKN